MKATVKEGLKAFKPIVVEVVFETQEDIIEFHKGWDDCHEIDDTPLGIVVYDALKSSISINNYDNK